MRAGRRRPVESPCLYRMCKPSSAISVLIGSLSRHVLAVHSVSPGNPALCLSLSQPQDVMAGTPTCGPFGENTVYTRSNGTLVNGTRSPYPNTIGTDAVYQNTVSYTHLRAHETRHDLVCR